MTKMFAKDEENIFSHIFFTLSSSDCTMNERDRRIAIVGLFQQGDQPVNCHMKARTHKKPTQGCVQYLPQVPRLDLEK